MAVGMAAFASAGMKMPLSAVALTVLLFGSNANEVFPEVAIAAVTAYALRVAIDKRRAAAPDEDAPSDAAAQAKADGPAAAASS
jgi:H+/Cl- antiporter ClcA